MVLLQYLSRSTCTPENAHRPHSVVLYAGSNLTRANPEKDGSTCETANQNVYIPIEGESV